jgi:predicted secreted hydrolase
LTAASLCAGVLWLSPVPGNPGEPFPPAFRSASVDYPYSFPRDHGTHDEFRTEWWYYIGHLSTVTGRRFGYELTFFRRSMNQELTRSNSSRWTIRHLYLAHLALSDHDGSRFRYQEKVSRAGVGKAGAEAGRLHVWIDRWSAEALSPQHDRHHLKASAEDFALDLMLRSEKPAVVHGERGISRKGSEPEQASHYYSLTRLATAGTLTVDGVPVAVTGTSWMDHEFGSGDLGKALVGWDWFSVQLDNRTELMLYQLRRADGTTDPTSSGTLIFPDGRSQHLTSADTQIEVLDRWTSAASGARYPSRWRISVPASGLLLNLVPEQSDQELITRRSTQVTYWEGAVRISGILRDSPISGSGYVELTGYAERFRQR